MARKQKQKLQAPEKRPVPSYLDGVEEDPSIEFVLDDGTKLPAHANILEKRSAVLRDMFSTADRMPASLWGVGSRRKDLLQLPLPGTTYKELSDFLTSVYAVDIRETFTKETLLSVLKLADKFVMREILECCDKHMAGLAGFDNHSRFELWDPVNGQSQALEHLILAERYQLHRLAACCERYVAIHYLSLSDNPQLAEISTAARDRMFKAVLVGLSKLTVTCNHEYENKKAKYPVNVPGSEKCSQCKEDLTRKSSRYSSEKHTVSHSFQIPSAAEMMEWAKQGPRAG